MFRFAFLNFLSTRSQFTSGTAAESQEYVMKLPERIRKLAERASARKAKAKKVDVQFSWIFDRNLKC